MAQITLVITNNCNLKCTYCYEVHNNSVMTIDTAKNIIDKEFQKAKRDEVMEIDFFGGEPFLCFSLIKEIFEYIKSQAKVLGQKFHCLATTNGTLIHGEIQKWLISNHKDFTVGLSLDGTKSMHNTNRCNSFDLIDLDFFINYYHDQSVKMTISKETLPFLFEGVKFLHEKGFEVNCNLAFGIDWSNVENDVILEEQLSKLIDYYLANPSIKPCMLLERSIIPVAFDNNRDIERPCGAGINMRTYDVDGKCYPCQFFMPISVGINRAKRLGEIKFCEKIPITLLNEECRNCCVNGICDTCYGSNYKERNDIYSNSMELCSLNKIVIKARSYFKAKQIILGQVKLQENEMQALLRSIKIIQEKLK